MALLKKTDCNAKVTEIEGKIPSISSLATNDVENKISNISSLTKKTDYDVKLLKFKRNLLIIITTNILQLQSLTSKLQKFLLQD